MLYHPKMKIFDERLKKMFDDIDDYLEDKYGYIYQLHPSRPRRGEASDKEADGLFNVGSSFTAGYGSELGRGYAVEIRMVTLEKVDPCVRLEVENETITLLNKNLAEVFPERKLNASRDGNIIKIHGDLNLGEL